MNGIVNCGFGYFLKTYVLYFITVANFFFSFTSLFTSRILSYMAVTNNLQLQSFLLFEERIRENSHY